jgi:alpha-ribazole phosphatase
MKTIFLIRHTTPHVEKGICYGHTDVPVAPSFAIEANIIAKKMDGFEPQALFSSPLGRCAHLTRHLFANHRPVFDERLKELNFGDWEMKRWDDIDQQQLDDWGRDFWSVAPPNGESFEELNRRVIELWDAEVTSNNASDIAVVCHSGVMRVVLMKLLHIPPHKIYNLHLDYGAVVRITWHDDITHKLHFL